MAVITKNVHYTYDLNDYTLTDVNIKVPTGYIYGLLGPSGCGKTTLLKCIIGLLQPKHGAISVFGYEPGDQRSGVPGSGIGYMPQELAVQFDLTIEEILIYFGTLNSMERRDINSKIDFMVQTLDLWDKKRLIGHLSGGQKRRVSLAIALLHTPRLLILDEPTVGVDPMLSEAIWRMLKNLSSTLNTTIIITTHYIDEAKRANCVAFMRKGMILEENNPKKLLQKYDSKNLDDLFLKLCVDQKERKRSFGRLSFQYNRQTGSTTGVVRLLFQPKAKSSSIHFLRIPYAIIWKFLTETRRNPIALMLLLTTTMSMIIAVKLVVGQTPRDIPVAFVIEDKLNDSNTVEPTIFNTNYRSNEEHRIPKLIKLLNASDAHYGFVEKEKVVFSLNNTEEYEELYLPDIFKRSIDGKIIRLIEYSNFSSAMLDAKKLIVRGIVRLKLNFSRNFLRCDPMFSHMDEYLTNETIDSAVIHVYLDYTNMVIGQTTHFVILSSLQTFRELIGEQFSIDKSLFCSPIIVQPINFEEDHHITSIEDLFGIATFMTAGIFSFYTFAVCIAMSTLSLLAPAECDMTVRAYAAGVRPVHLVLGQVIARFIFLSFNAILNLLSMVYILKVPCRGSVPLILIVMWMQMLLGLNIGTLISSLITDVYFSGCTTLAITLSLFSISGVLWGTEAQPYYVKWFGQFNPLTNSMDSLRALLFFSKSPIRTFWYAFGLTGFSTTLLFLASVFVFSRKN